MSVRPVDLQQVVQRVTEAQRGRFGGQGEQEAEKAAVAQAAQSRADAGRAGQEVRAAPPGSEALLRQRREREGGKERGQAGGGYGGRSEGREGEARLPSELGEESEPASGGGEAGPGAHLDLLA